MCVVHVYDACIKKKHILGIPYIQVVCLENLAIWHWFGACVDLGWWITICIVCQMFFFVFWNAHRFGNSMFSSVLFCHLVFFVTVLSSVFVSVHDVAILIVHCSWGRQVCPQSCCLSVFHVRLAKTNLRMANTKIAHSWYCTCSGASQSTLVYTIWSWVFFSCTPKSPHIPPRCVAMVSLESTPAWLQDAPNIYEKRGF